MVPEKSVYPVDKVPAVPFKKVTVGTPGDVPPPPVFVIVTVPPTVPTLIPVPPAIVTALVMLFTLGTPPLPADTVPVCCTFHINTESTFS
jgi:hypothetical protein